MTLYSAVYVLWPHVTNNAKDGVKISKCTLLVTFNWRYWYGCIMGMAGLDGMLRRHMYFNGEFDLMMILAGICGAMVLLAWIIFLF